MSNFRKKFDFNKVKSNMEKTEKREKKDFTDSRFWNIKPDPKTHLGSALIRFLPDPETGDTWKKYLTHWFTWDENGTRRYYVKNCASTNGDPCPVCVKVSEYYNSPYDSDKKLGAQRKRNTKFISNIYVIKDPLHPENEGKVFLYDYGPMIQKMYSKAMYGSKDTVKDVLDDDNTDEKTYVPCHFDEGADFLLKATPGDGDIKHTYIQSKFKTQTAFFGEMEEADRDIKIDEVMGQAYRLSDFPKKDSFPTPEEVISILGAELGVQQVSSIVTTDRDTNDFTADEEPFESDDISVQNTSTPEGTDESNDESTIVNDEQEQSVDAFISGL